MQPMVFRPSLPNVSPGTHRGQRAQRPVSGSHCSFVRNQQHLWLPRVVAPSPSHSSHNRVPAAATAKTTATAPLAPILITTLDHCPGTECAHNQWVLWMLTSLSGLLVASSNTIFSHLPSPLNNTTDTMPTGAILRSRMSLPITEKQPTTGGIGYPAHPAFYIA